MSARPQSIQRTKSNFNAQVGRSSSNLNSPPVKPLRAVEMEMRSPGRASSPIKPARGGTSSSDQYTKAERRARPPPPPSGEPSSPVREKSSRPVSMARGASVNNSSNPVKAAPPAAPAAASASVDRAVFVGQNPLQYVLWGHYMAYCSAILGILLGIFEVSYHWADPWQCKVEGVDIAPEYIQDSFGTCPTFYDGEQLCCDPSNENTRIDGKFYDLEGKNMFCFNS